MTVPYIFSNVPGGSSIPLSELDVNFAYITSGTSSVPTRMGWVDMSGNLTVAGTSTFNGSVLINGPLTINGFSVNPTGITGTNLLVFNTNPTLVSPVLGTPESGNLSLCTGYSVNNITGLGANVLPFLKVPSSENLLAAVTDETGTGLLVFNNSPAISTPTLVSPNLGTPASGILTNCGGYLAPNLSGVTPIVNGGTGMSVTGAVGEVIAVTAPGVLGYVPSPPSSGIAGGAPSQILYQSAINTTSFVPNGTIGQVLLSNGVAAPAWGQVNATIGISGILPIANGGTGISALGTGVQAALSNPVNAPGGFLPYAALPAGAVQFFAMSAAPSGWLVANGAAISRTTYATLFAAIGTLYGVGDGTTTFNLPNLDGQFVRGWDSSGLVDPGRTFGSSQGQSFASHTHAATVTDPGHSHIMSQNVGGVTSGANFTTTAVVGGIPPSWPTQSALTGITVANASTGGTETRPVNVALLACIKY